MNQNLNPTSLDTVCAALAYAMGIEAPAHAAEPNPLMIDYIDRVFGDRKADRIFMYNPDAAAQWICEKYPACVKEVTARTSLEVPLCSPMPSVTPVCFGTMYTGAQPEVHGIQSYTKPVITIDTIFDALIRAGKKPVILAYGTCSMSKIFLERPMDYFHFNTITEVNAKAAQLILEDNYDFYVVYNGNYDGMMHRHGPESLEALIELRQNDNLFAMFETMIAEHWKNHRTLTAFAMDHGAHEIDGQLGSHGLDMPEDRNIKHFYNAIIGEAAK